MLNLALALAALLSVQEPGVPPIQLGTQGGAEAPAQPTGRSGADYVRGPRNVPQAASIAEQRVRTPVGSLVEVRGQEDNQLIGVGLVSGLSGTGDSLGLGAGGCGGVCCACASVAAARNRSAFTERTARRATATR